MHSLYGGKVARERAELLLLPGGKALAGNVGGQQRRQTVLTRHWFLDQLIATAGAPIGYDPCTTEYNPCKAKVFSVEDANNPIFGGGLNVNWARQSDRHGWVYANPPYKYLKLWMQKALMESERGAKIYMLAPCRPWRTWFCDLVPAYSFHWESHLDHHLLVALAPLSFVGEKSAYPAPLCVIPYNLPLPTIVNPKGKNMVTGIWDVRSAA